MFKDKNALAWNMVLVLRSFFFEDNLSLLDFLRQRTKFVWLFLSHTLSVSFLAFGYFCVPTCPQVLPIWQYISK